MGHLLTVDDVADLRQMTPRFVEQQIRLDYIEAFVVGKRTSRIDGYNTWGDPCANPLAAAVTGRASPRRSQ